MTAQTLTPPQDITWTRMAFARDMIDTNFGDQLFRPKWRSSLAVYYYFVPDEETADAYPNSRIVYLKFTASITGFNPSEELLGVKKAAEEAGTWDDLQRTLWQVIVSSGWAATYWPCLGAIMQLAVYPNNAEGVAPDDYPYIMDFEPKKRELFEQVTEGNEFLAGSAETVATTKGSTNTQSVGAKGGGTFLGIGMEASASASWQQVDSRTTDTSRESRETQSRSTSFSQMYQLFNGYHLGTNRGLFVIAPRPHTVSTGAQTDFNLINGERKLEGIQEVFLVVHVPRQLGGFCIQAGLDTGHLASVTTPRHLVMLKPKDNGPTDGNDGGVPPPPPPPDSPTKQLVITRRVIQACGAFDENGKFTVAQLREPRPPRVVGEIAVADLATKAIFRAAPGGDVDRRIRIQVANNLNAVQSEINRAMLDSTTAADYEPRSFEDSNVFKSLVASAASKLDVPLTELVHKGYLDAEAVKRLGRRKLRTIGDLFAQPFSDDADDVSASRTAIVENLLRRRRERE